MPLITTPFVLRWFIVNMNGIRPDDAICAEQNTLATYSNPRIIKVTRIDDAVHKTVGSQEVRITNKWEES